MPSLALGYVPQSGFTPLVSGGLLFSGHLVPVGGIQIRSWKQNSGSIYVSLSGGNPVSGQQGLLVLSGGPTINSGTIANPALGNMDSMELSAGDSYFIPKLGIQNTGSQSGIITIAIGCDPACSGQARVFYEIF